MITTDTSKDDSKQPLLSHGTTQDNESATSYGGTNGEGPSTGVTYAQVASQPPSAQALASAPASTQPSYQVGAHPNQYAQYSATPPGAQRPGYTNTHHRGDTPPPPHEPAWKRFLKAFGVVILVWILLSMLASSIADFGVPRVGNRLASPTKPVAVDGVVQACYGHGARSGSSRTDGRWSEVPSSSRSHGASLDLDLGKAGNAALYLLTRGNSAAGSVTIEEGSSAQVGVRVVVDYDPEIYPFNKVWQVCVLQDGTERGLGIYFPEYERALPRRKFNVRVMISLPKTRITRFRTDTRNYALIHNVANGTTFDSLRLMTVDSRIEAKTPVTATTLSASAINGLILGTYSGDMLTMGAPNGHISGTFNASWLTLETTNGAIDVDATVYHGLIFTSTNAPIRGPISFVGNAKTFSAELSTSNNAIDVRVPKLPYGAALSLNARTANAAASLVLPATFEGRIWQGTSNSGTPKLNVAKNLRDPVDKRREYVVASVTGGKGHREDLVGWGTARGAGNITVATSNGASAVSIVQEP